MQAWNAIPVLVTVSAVSCCHSPCSMVSYDIGVYTCLPDSSGESPPPSWGGEEGCVFSCGGCGDVGGGGGLSGLEVLRENDETLLLERSFGATFA
jgi:hypothetical protein